MYPPFPPILRQKNRHLPPPPFPLQFGQVENSHGQSTELL